MMSNFKKHLKLVIFPILLLIGSHQAFSQQVKPNIIYIISDDQAWGDFGFMGHPSIQTPNIDQLVKESVTYTRGYVTSPLCSPSLASIITGLYPQQTKVTGNDPLFESSNPRYGKEWQLERQVKYNVFLDEFQKRKTVPQILGENGYLSLQTGKWWGRSYKDAGFTHGMTIGDAASGGRHGDAGLAIGREGMEPIYDFINEAESKSKPFMVWYAPFLPHSPHTPPQELLDKYLKVAPSEAIAKYWAMCEWLDITVGELMGFLEEKSIKDNTMVVFVVDNGWVQDPEATNKFMVGSKQDPQDNGIRTPIIVHWPAQLKPILDKKTPVSSLDIAVTTLDAAGITPLPEMEGLSLLKPADIKKRDRVFSVDFSHDMVDVHLPEKSLEHRVLIQGDWKLIISEVEGEQKVLLYDIQKDPGENTNIADLHPQRVKEMQQEVERWWRRTNQ